MIHHFKTFVRQKQLFAKKERVLLAVSGGMDSMAMAYLFHLAGFDFGIAHCNFHLRGTASNGDEALVKRIAQQWRIPFYTTSLDPKIAVKKENSSIQLVARTMRYEWFEQIRSHNNFVYVATAHHINDSLETLLYNIAKGCGIRGLHGIPVKQGNIIRPLLFASRKDIIDFVAEKSIPYREDASNQSIKYKRNLIRHTIIPQLQSINPTLETTFSKTVIYLKEAELLFDEIIQQYKKQYVQETAKQITIQKTPIVNHPAKRTILYELLRPYGFNGEQIEQIIKSKDQIGVKFFSPSYQLLVDRVVFFIRLKMFCKENFITVKDKNKKVIISQLQFTFSSISKEEFTLQQPPNIALLDDDAIQFPITIRYWQEGDRFQPLGMKGKSKKMQDFFSDQKLSRFEKEEVLLMESNGQICWVVGYRIDERFKIRETTKKILKIEVVERAGIH